MRDPASNLPPRLVAVAPGPPLDVTTQSGRSHHLFTSIGERGVRLTPIDSRDFRPWDVLRGALDLRQLARAALTGQSRVRVRPEWYWSRRAHELFWRRFAARLRAEEPHDALLQVGTHIRVGREDLPSYCMTDCTVTQAVEAGSFAVSRASSSIVREAFACQREVFESCHGIFVLSEWAARSVVEDYGIDRERVVVSGTGVNVRERPPRDPDHERPYVLFVGKDWIRKGGPLLLEAFERARRARPRLELKIVGCRPDVRGEGIEVLGRLTKADPAQNRRLLELYARAICFCILPDFDPFPNVLLEAQYIGLPVVATDEGSRREAVIPGETGWLVEDRDPDRIARALIEAVDDPDRLSAMGSAARRFVEARFTWPLVVDRMLDRMGLLQTASRTDGARPGASLLARSERADSDHAKS